MKRGGKIYASFTSPPLIVLEDNQDLMEVVVKCPNCGQPTKYGETRMISGYIGCDNKYRGKECYFDDLMPRILEAKERTEKDPELKKAYIESRLYAVIMEEEHGNEEEENKE